MVEAAPSWGSRPPSAASCELLSNSSTLADLAKPPVPPKARPLGGIHVYKRDSVMSIESHEEPPELPIKISPSKSHRDSGYEVSNDRRSTDLQVNFYQMIRLIEGLNFDKNFSKTFLKFS